MAVTVHGRALFGKELSPTEADQHINLFRQDAQYGTFGSIPENAFRSHEAYEHFCKERDAVDVQPEYDAASLRKGDLRFCLSLPAALFDDEFIGVQRLVHFLCGDLFERAFLVGTGANILVDRVDVPDLPRVTASGAELGWKAEEILKRFQTEGRPLLAFSMKPRSGLTKADYLHLVNEALSEGRGVDIVEMDTRDFARTPSEYLGFVEPLATAACNSGGIFSPNLSGPRDGLLDVIKLLTDRAAKINRPAVVKVDVSLDGLSTMQWVRRTCLSEGIPQPVITTYPSLTYVLGSRIGGDTLFRLASMAGSDVIYPGGQPKLRADLTPDIAADVNLQKAKRRYEVIVKAGRPMPTIAGGIHVGLLHAYYALFGPAVAYFIGGGISLARGGVSAGACACRQVLEKAVAFRKDGVWDADKFNAEFAALCDIYDDHGGGAPQYYNPARCEIDRAHFPYG
jgi:ribulose 1,5-bisphosphate carboxylase large subunit-like protein